MVCRSFCQYNNIHSPEWELFLGQPAIKFHTFYYLQNNSGGHSLFADVCLGLSLLVVTIVLLLLILYLNTKEVSEEENNEWFKVSDHMIGTLDTLGIG